MPAKTPRQTFDFLKTLDQVTTPIPYRILYRSNYNKEATDLFYQIVAFIQNVVFKEKPTHPAHKDQPMFHVLEESFPYCYVYQLRYIPGNYSDVEVKSVEDIQNFQHHLNVELNCGKEMVAIWENINPVSRMGLCIEALHKVGFTKQIGSTQYFLDNSMKSDKDKKFMKANFFPLLGVWLKSPKDHTDTTKFSKIFNRNKKAYLKIKSMKDKFAFFKLSLHKHLQYSSSHHSKHNVHEIFLNELIVQLIQEAGNF